MRGVQNLADSGGKALQQRGLRGLTPALPWAVSIPRAPCRWDKLGTAFPEKAFGLDPENSEG